MRIFVKLNVGNVSSVEVSDDADVITLRKAIKVEFPDEVRCGSSNLVLKTPDAAGAELTDAEAAIASVVKSDKAGPDGKLRVYVVVPRSTTGLVVARKSIEELLEELKVEIDENVLCQMQSRFATQVLSAVVQQSADLALDTYERAKHLPSPSTIAFWETLGIQLCEQVFCNNPRLATCIKNGEPRILKSLTQAEYERQASALGSGVEFLPTHHLVPFEVIERKLEGQLTTKSNKQEGVNACITMPWYFNNLQSIPSDSKFPIERLWNEIKVAVNHLHSKGFAHSDIKPENIFMGMHGEFLLGDHGNIAKFGALTHSTPAYVPSDARSGHDSTQRASAALDWWMLAMTLLDKIAAGGGGAEQMVGGTRGWTKEKVKLEIDKFAFLKELSALLALEQNRK